MALRIVRLGSPRHPEEGLRIGAVRRPPRGVAKEDYAARDFYDVWLPTLAPSAQLLSWVHVEPMDAERYKVFARRYREEMDNPDVRHLLDLLAALSAQSNLSVGCYCEEESLCHRSVLRELLARHGARFA
jgi:uncharacterized protein YeaO (DUF488 family)